MKLHLASISIKSLSCFTASFYADTVCVKQLLNPNNTTGRFFSSNMNPGMENSLAYSSDFYTAAHFGFKKALRFKCKFWSPFSQRMAINLFDVVSMQMPLAFSWLRDEYHLSVITQYNQL